MKTDNKHFYDSITDDEIRVVGDTNTEPRVSPNHRPPSHRWRTWIVVTIAAVALAAIILFLITRHEESPQMEPYQDAVSEVNVAIDTLATPEDSKSYTEVKLDTINDIHLRIFTPQGGKPELKIGKMDADSTQFILAAQAADVRGDNGEISGAFILGGELKSKGMPKLGFCAIISDEITIGRQSETPLFERAIEANGYFFRQYSLVSSGNMIEIKPKGKAMRRALCYLNGKICIIETIGRESYHDFAQALADYGVEEAIALVGGNATLTYRTETGMAVCEGMQGDHKYENANFIVWI